MMDNINNISITLENIKSLNRTKIAELYAVEISKKMPMNHYADLNRIILTKYKMSGLIYIKELAWSILEHNQIDKAYSEIAKLN